MGAAKFEELRAWQQARNLTNSVYTLSQTGSLSKDFALKDQLRRAAMSIMANIAEGFDCNSRTEFLRFLGYARRSSVEILSLLYLCLDAAYISREEFNDHYEMAIRTKATVSALMKSLKSGS